MEKLGKFPEEISPWDIRFLEMAKKIAEFSKDPSTKTGAIIVRDKRIISMGFNGLPQKVKDSSERLSVREIKLQIILHAEENAILFSKTCLKGSTIYTWPFMPCAKCASWIIQSDIEKVVAPENSWPKWEESCNLAKELFNESGINLCILKVS